MEESENNSEDNNKKNKPDKLGWLRRFIGKKTEVTPPLPQPSPSQPIEVTEVDNQPLASENKNTPDKNVIKPQNRDERMRLYQEEKLKKAAIEVKEQSINPDPLSLTKDEYQRPKNLHEAFYKVEKTKEGVYLNERDLPWLDKPISINLYLITLNESDHFQFYYGSGVHSKDLVDAASAQDRKRSEIITNLLYTRLPVFIRRRASPLVWEVSGNITKRKIYYVGNNSGQRAYFMVLDNFNDKPVIIRIAVCDKAQEREVLGVLTNRHRKQIDDLGKL